MHTEKGKLNLTEVCVSITYNCTVIPRHAYLGVLFFFVVVAAAVFESNSCGDWLLCKLL